MQATETQSRVFEFCYQLDGEPTPRFEEKEWRLSFRAGYNLMWRMLLRRFEDRLIWLEC